MPFRAVPVLLAGVLLVPPPAGADDLLVCAVNEAPVTMRVYVRLGPGLEGGAYWDSGWQSVAGGRRHCWRPAGAASMTATVEFQGSAGWERVCQRSWRPARSVVIALTMTGLTSYGCQEE